MMKLVMALALGTVANVGAAAAQDTPAPRRGGMGMMRADTNGDGVVTRAEYAAQVDARFARMDANGDGRLDADEMPRFGIGRGRAAGGDASPPPPAGGTQPPPAPPAGGITRDQFRAMAMERFNRMDANRDGKLDAGEMPRFGPASGGPGGRPGSPPTPPAN